MLHLIKYRFFSVLREKTTMFWGFVFPLILCTLFYVTFGDTDNTLDCINTAAVVRNDTTEAKAFEVFLKAVEDSGEDLFAVEWMEEKEAKEKLEDDVTNLTTPAMENTVVMDAIQNGADGYLAGEKSLEAAVEEIYKALELWMYEK